MASKVLVLLTWAVAAGHDLKSGKIRRQLLGNLKPEAPSGHLSTDSSNLQTQTRSFTSLTTEYPFYHSTDEIAEQARGIAEKCASTALLDELSAVGKELGVEEYATVHGVSLTGVSSEVHSVLHLAAEELRLGQIAASFFGVVTRAVPAELVDRLTTGGRPTGSSALHMVAGSKKT
ncbi:unnamed protein product [Symbiodinium sp. CCMP2592]|nr:unnamed protein product [Symbiodinium sp. CCMP2592]